MGMDRLYPGYPDRCSSQAGTLVDVALMDGDAVPTQLGTGSSSREGEAMTDMDSNGQMKSDD